MQFQVLDVFFSLNCYLQFLLSCSVSNLPCQQKDQVGEQLACGDSLLVVHPLLLKGL